MTSAPRLFASGLKGDVFGWPELGNRLASVSSPDGVPINEEMMGITEALASSVEVLLRGHAPSLAVAA